jgi:nucleoside-diphosphate-sugar epimerase
MNVLLTGASGHLGSTVLAALLAAGHTVTAPARTAATVTSLKNLGARAVLGDVSDPAWLADRLGDAGGAIHCASPNDRTSATLDRTVLAAVVTAFAGTGRPYVHTAGTWAHGSHSERITELTPFAPPPIVAWRPAVVGAVREAARQGVRSAVIAPGNVYGRGRGIPALITHGPRTADASLLFPGTGEQHLSNVHSADLADLYLLALDSAPAGSYYLGANDVSPTMSEVAEAAGHGQGLDGRTAADDPAATRARLGPLTDALLLDQQIDNSHARELGWTPTGPTLLDELATGSYAIHSQP